MRTMNEERMSALAEYIKQYARENNGEMPSLSDMMNDLGLPKTTTYRYVLELERRGIVSYAGKRTLQTPLHRKMHCEFRKVPLVGQIVCGSPDEQEEHVSAYLAIPQEWIEGECFLLQAYGDSMVDAGIEKGDLILVKRAESAGDRDIVVALTENGNTLKRLFWENGRPRLHAENKTYPANKIDIYPQKLTIQGIALKVIKNLHGRKDASL